MRDLDRVTLLQNCRLHHTLNSVLRANNEKVASGVGHEKTEPFKKKQASLWRAVSSECGL